MSITDIFNVSKLGILGSQSALQVVSHNIANVNTEGYSRQTAVLGTNSVQAQRVGVNGSLISGDGVKVETITRTVDQLVEKRILLGEQELGRLNTRDRFLTMVEDEFNDLDGDGFSQRMENFFAAADSLADNPLNPVAREEFVARSQSLTNFANRIDESLSELALPVDTEVTVTIQDINTRLRALEQVNNAIIRQGLGNSDQALDLQDQRQKMVVELAGLMDIQVLQPPNSNGITIMSGSGKMLLEQGYAAQFERGTVSNATGFQEIRFAGTQDDVTNLFQGGAMRGLIEIRDQIINGSQGYLTQLENLVDEIRFQTNKVHSTSASQSLYTSLTGVFDLGSDTTLNALSSLNTGAGTTVTATGSGTAGAVSVGAMDQKHEIYPGVGTEVIMTYAAANGQFVISENGSTASYSPVASSGAFPEAVSLKGWVDVTFPSAPTDGDTFAFTVPQFDAPPDLSRVVDGELVIAHAADSANMDSFTPITVAITASSTIQQVVDDINAAAPANTVTASIDANNRFVLSVADPTAEVFAIASGLGALFSGSGAKDMQVNSELTGDASRVAFGKIDMTDPTAPIFDDGGNRGALDMGSLRSTSFTVNDDSATFGAHFATMVGTIGSERRQNQDETQARQSAQDFMTEIRSSISGVSLEEEMTDLMKFQRSFQASSKMIAAADEMMQMLLQIV